MPAPYPRSDPGRTVASKVNRGAPRGAGQARGLSTPRGTQQFENVQPAPGAVPVVGGATYTSAGTAAPYWYFVHSPDWGWGTDPALDLDADGHCYVTIAGVYAFAGYGSADLGSGGSTLDVKLQPSVEMPSLTSFATTGTASATVGCSLTLPPWYYDVGDWVRLSYDLVGTGNTISTANIVAAMYGPSA